MYIYNPRKSALQLLFIMRILISELTSENFCKNSQWVLAVAARNSVVH